LFLQANASRAATAPAQQSGSGNTLIDSKGYDEVMAAYDRAIALEPANAAYRNRLGVALFNQKRHTEALAAFDKSVALDSSNAAYHNWRGLALLNLKRYQEALAAFDKALALESSSATYRSNREAALRALNLSSKAPVNAGSSAGAAAPAPAQRSGSGNTALPTSQPTQAATTRAGFQTFTSSDNSFRIAYPGDWQQKAASSGIGATFTSPDQQKVFTITAANPGTSSADPAAVVVAACSGVDGTPSSPEPVRIGGQSWTEAECDTSKYGSNIHFVAEAVLYKGNMFLIIYTSPKESFESIARQFFTPMEQSFQFLR
jgi:Flp pilus assembly protein TadD